MLTLADGPCDYHFVILVNLQYSDLFLVDYSLEIRKIRFELVIIKNDDA